VTVLSLSLARLALSTSCDNIPSHSASHSFLLQPHSGTLESVRGRDKLSIARSTSRHRRKRSAASPRREAKVSGERNRPVRRAIMEVGRKDDKVRFGIGLGVRDVSRGSRMMGIWGPKVSIRRVSRGDGDEDNIRMSAVCSGVEGDESRLDITADAE